MVCLEWVTALVVAVSTGYFVWLEVLQIQDNPTYFCELTNYIDISSAVLTYFLLIFKVNDDGWYNFATQQKIAVIAVAMVWYKAFYWMRLFDTTAFFINLLNATFKGITAFMIMVILLLFGVSNVMYILNLQQNEE